MTALLKNKILNILYPEKCPVCGGILTDAVRCKKNPYICSFCYGKLRFVTEESCLKCSRPLEDETKALCSLCMQKERYFDRGFALTQHDAAAKHMIYGFKFSFELDNIRFPALEIAFRYGQDLLYLGIEAFIPVPLHKSRRRERGYNQAKLLAEEISKYMLLIYDEAPACDCTFLVRNKKTKHQKELDHSRREENVRDAFSVIPETSRVYQRVCIVDDIFTTGSTVDSCAKALKKAGCLRVYFLTVSIVGTDI